MKRTTTDMMRDGLVAGFIGYLVLALFHATLSTLLLGSPWQTLEELGRAFFGPGTSGPGPLIAFNGLHLLLFLIIGFLGAVLVHELELHQRRWYELMIVGIVTAIAVIAITVTIAGFVSGRAPVVFLIADLVAFIGVTAYLLWRHPGVRNMAIYAEDKDDIYAP